MKPLLLAALLLSTAEIVLCQSTTAKKPSEWTDEERIAVRGDAAKARERVAAMHERTVRFGTTEGKTLQLDGDFIDGSSNPELFFAHELFRAWIQSALRDGAEREYIDALYGEALRNLGFPGDTWSRLERITTDYRSVVLRNKALAQRIARLSPAEQDKKFDEQMAAGLSECRALHAALQEAVAEFGEERLLRLLYEYVVQGFGIGVAGVEKAEVLRYHAKGCP